MSSFEAFVRSRTYADTSDIPKHIKLCKEAELAIKDRDIKRLELLTHQMSAIAPSAHLKHDASRMLYHAMNNNDLQISQWLTDRFGISKYDVATHISYLSCDMLEGRSGVAAWYIQTFGWSASEIGKPLVELLKGKHYDHAHHLATIAGCDHHHIRDYILQRKSFTGRSQKLRECALFADYYLSINPRADDIPGNCRDDMLKMMCKINHVRFVQLLVEQYGDGYTLKYARELQYYALPQARKSGGTQAIEWLVKYYKRE